MDGPPPAEPMGYLAAVLLGAVQGATEFLPVSSSGHLALAQAVGLGYKAPLMFDLLLHVATVLVVFKAFWADFVDFLRTRRRVVLWIVLACVPTAAGGFLLKDQFKAIGEHPTVVAAMLLVTACILLLAGGLRVTPRPLDELGFWRSLAVGAAQTLAITPGISRSGTTIVAGLGAGLSRPEAVKFSFSLMVPAVVGATGLEALSGWRDWHKALAAAGPDDPVPSLFEGLSLGPCVAGFLAALVVGYASLALLRLVVEKDKLPYFALYCALAGAAGVIYFDMFG